MSFEKDPPPVGSGAAELLRWIDAQLEKVRAELERLEEMKQDKP